MNPINPVKSRTPARTAFLRRQACEISRHNGHAPKVAPVLRKLPMLLRAYYAVKTDSATNSLQRLQRHLRRAKSDGAAVSSFGMQAHFLFMSVIKVCSIWRICLYDASSNRWRHHQRIWGDPVPDNPKDHPRVAMRQESQKWIKHKHHLLNRRSMLSRSKICRSPPVIL